MYCLKYSNEIKKITKTNLIKIYILFTSMVAFHIVFGGQCHLPSSSKIKSPGHSESVLLLELNLLRQVFEGVVISVTDSKCWQHEGSEHL